MFAMHRTNRFSDYIQSSSDTAWTWRKRRQQQAQRTNVLSPHDLGHGSSSLVCSAERHSPRTTARIKKTPAQTKPTSNKVRADSYWRTSLCDGNLPLLHGKLKHFQPHKVSCSNCMTLPIIQQCVCKSDQQPVIENILKQSILFRKRNDRYLAA